MKRALIALMTLMFFALPLSAQKRRRANVPVADAKPVAGAYVPDPKQWQMYLLSPMGGWTTERHINVEFKIVDPHDPKPPKDVARKVVDEDMDSGESDEGPDYYEGLKRRENEEWSDFYARVNVERNKNVWRNRKVEIHFNGEKQVQDFQVGRKGSIYLDLQDGENRLELRQPDSGKYAVRTIWASNSRDRLVIRMTQEGENEQSWWWGGLQVVEPDSTESIAGEPTPSGGKNKGNSYTHATPLPGTYTVRWFDTRAGVDGYEWGEGSNDAQAAPKKVVIEILLDPNTDRERRWKFERLVMPGTKRVTMGSFDVED
jgi:hypothetical protein